MEATQARKAAAPSKSARTAPSTQAHAAKVSQQADGAASGLPLFLQQRLAESSSDQDVQLWDCSEYAEPTCVQSQLDDTIQTKCAACAKEDAALDKESTDDSDVQLWDCAEYAEPTCVQSQLGEADALVQAKCTACEAEERVQAQSTPAKRPSPQVIRREAARGLQGANQALPHRAVIQAAFGHHDISAVRTMVGGKAATASRRMGALAFTAGSRIGFRGTPGLHLAAHEAAHTVQQQAGLSLPNRVGQAGDRYERHADQVADAVVTGRSAEPLLDEVAAPSGFASEGQQSTENDTLTAATPTVQRQITSGATRLFEPSSVREGSSEPVTGREAAPETSTAEAESSNSDAAGDALEATAAEASETPPAGAESEASAASPTAESTTSSTRGAGACYSASSEARPEEVEEPSSDNRGAESEAAPQVTFEPWPPEADECPAEQAVAEGSERMPESIGADSSGGIDTAVDSSGGAASATAPATATEGGAPSESPEVQALSRATGVEASTAATSAMDGQIAIAEGGRDAAVGDYLASTGALSGVLARSQALTSGVTFPAAASSQQAENRQAAIAQTRDFMGRAAHQIASAVAFAQEQVPGMLRAAAESAKGSMQGAIETEKTAISDRIDQARAQARAGAATARAQVRAEYASSATTIEAVTLEAISALDSTHTTSVELVDEKETLGLDDVNARFTGGRRQHEEKGPEYADRAIAQGQTHVAGYEHCKGDYSDDGFWDGCLTVRRAKAQQDAACKTAAGYKDTFLRTANRKGYDLLPLRRQYRCAVIAGASQVNQTLDDTHAQLVSGLESGRMQALDGVAMARDASLAAIDNALMTTLETLSAQAFSQRQAVNDVGYLKQLAVEQLAHTGAAGLARGISAAMDSLEQTLMRLRDRFAQGNIPDPAELRRSLAVTEAALGGGVGTLLDTMMAGALGTESRIAEMGAAALEELALLTSQNDERSAQTESSFAQQMDGLKSGAAGTFGQLTDNHIQQTQQAMTDGTASMEQAVSGFDEALATIGGNVDEAIATSLAALDQELSAKLSELDGQIIREAWKAAEKEQPAWKSVVAIILVIVVIIAAAIISIVTLGAGASLFAVILVGALVGAVSGGLIQLINNWASGEAWHQGLAQAMIMGAIGGAIGGGLGFAGGALVSGAAAAGARAVTQLGITLTADIVSEATTQAVGYFAFGQQFNWQGFVMAGVMSGVSFRAHPGGARAGAPHVDVPTPSAAGAAAGRRAAVAQVAGGAAVGLGVEAATAAISGEKFDLTRAASAAASGAVGARMARRGGAATPTPESTVPHSRVTSTGPDVDISTGSRARGSEPATHPIAEPATPRSRPTEEPASRPAAEVAEPSTRPREDEPSTRAEREAAVRESSRTESSELSQRQIDNELRHLAENPDLVQGRPPKRRARIGEHEWEEQSGGSWCRHSNGSVCAQLPLFDIGEPAVPRAPALEETVPAPAQRQPITVPFSKGNRALTFDANGRPLLDGRPMSATKLREVYQVLGLTHARRGHDPGRRTADIVNDAATNPPSYASGQFRSDRDFFESWRAASAAFTAGNSTASVAGRQLVEIDVHSGTGRAFVRSDKVPPGSELMLPFDIPPAHPNFVELRVTKVRAIFEPNGDIVSIYPIGG